MTVHGHNIQKRYCRLSQEPGQRDPIRGSTILFWIESFDPVRIDTLYRTLPAPGSTKKIKGEKKETATVVITIIKKKRQR
jgi:hypothetical protein